MKHMKLTTALLPILAIVLCISCNKSKQPAVNNAKTTGTASQIASGKIVYVEIDTVMKHYEMAKDVSSSMEIKQKRLAADLDSKSKSLQSGVLDFQNKVQKGLVTQASAQEIQQQLKSQEQSFYQLQDQYRSQLAEDAQVNQRQVLNSIMEYLKEYNKTKGYQYILANQFPSSILYADSTLNITYEVIAGLNAKYKTDKKPTK
jgi:outer membrane protein